MLVRPNAAAEVLALRYRRYRRVGRELNLSELSLKRIYALDNVSPRAQAQTEC
jgi:hypothetical protein